MVMGVDGRTYQKHDFANAQTLLVVFTCNHCPYAQAVEDRIIALQRAYSPSAMQIVAVCSNDASAYPDDAFDKIQERWRNKRMPFPYLYDESQELAKTFGAVCTPDFFLYDKDRALRYRGRLDDNWKEPAKVTKQELKEAIDALLAGKNPSDNQNPSMGCSIKWR
jgi:thiol-disulfide isomerase/thioredoxin